MNNEEYEGENPNSCLHCKKIMFNFSMYISRTGKLMQKLKTSMGSLFKAKSSCEQTVDDIQPTEIIKDGQKLMILGFFDRGNVGDEAFIAPYQILFPEKVLSFHSIDDVEIIPQDTAAVIVAGGDVINHYFISKLEDLLKSYNGPCYAFSVGAPFPSEMHYANVFDHVVLRSKQDIDALGNVIGNRNVSYLPDISWMQNTLVPIINKPMKPSGKPLTFGICLAQPYFYENENENDLIDSIIKFVYSLIKTYKNCKINLISFNTSVYEDESDHIINEKVMKKLSNYENVHNCIQTSLHQPLEMIKFIGQHDMIIGMRYHSILFSIMQNVPFVSMYTSRKIKNLLLDYNLSQYGLEMANGFYTKYKPTTVDVDKLTAMVAHRLKTTEKHIEVNPEVFATLREIVGKKQTKQMIVKNFVDLSCEDTLKRCQSMIQTYLNIDESTYEQWENGKLQTKTLLANAKKEPLDFARLIGFGITNKIGAPYVWGLKDNMLKPDFIPSEAFKWIYEDFACLNNNAAKEHTYYPKVSLKRNVVIDLNYMCQDNYQGLHRSGWSYVISGLQHLDGKNLDKPSNIVVDTCLERTFMWGLDVTKSSKIVPYKQPWTGFVHHTFDTKYSKYNCDTLINNKEFLDSLPHCKCLITLSKDLQKKFKVALTNKGHPNVPVVSLVHPTEIVTNTFDMTKFLSNPARKVVNIGAWLRDPYAIHSLPIPDNNRIGIQKYSLKGKEMDNYFMPSWLFEKMFDFLVDYSQLPDAGQTQTISRQETIIQSIVADVVSRSGSGSGSVLNTPIQNKYIEGMVKQIYQDEQSVNVLENLSNVEYDDLLSKNVVFLSFSSAPSASNTVVECIVRNTPLIVNRYPALEELLGKDYPGFYTTGNLFQAAAMLIDLNHLYVISEYMKTIDKTPFTLDHFMNDFQTKLIATM